MMYNSRLGPHPGKLKLRYIGPFKIVQDLGQGTFRLQDLYGTMVEKPVNGFRLKKFFGKVPVSELADHALKLAAVQLNMVSPVDACCLQHGCTGAGHSRGAPRQYGKGSKSTAGWFKGKQQCWKLGNRPKFFGKEKSQNY